MRMLTISTMVLAGTMTLFAQNSRNLSEADLKLRSELEADTSIIRVACWESRSNAIPPDDLRNRRLALETLKSGKGIFKLKVACESKEGVGAINYLLIEDGKSKLVSDTTHDKFGTQRILSRDCESLTLGSAVLDRTKQAIVFTPIPAGADISPENKFFQCMSGDKSLIF